MTRLDFDVTPHTGFRVGAAYGRDGVDAAVDRDDPLPADHLKGIMREAATRLLGTDHPCVAAVFGTSRDPSPWSWTSASPTGTWTFDRRHRVAIDKDTHSARKDMLVLAEQTWSEGARFTVERFRSLPQSGPGAAYDEADHVMVLRAAAAAVHGLGSWRRRGLGWVGIRPADGAPTDTEIAKILTWREARR